MNNYRNRISQLLLTVFMLLIPAVAYASFVTVETAQVRIRDGAGNYYEVTYIAPKGARLEVISEAEGWLLVKTPDGKKGYVSKKSLASSTNKDRFSEPVKGLRGDAGVGAASSGEIMAATKGVIPMGNFAHGYARKNHIDPRTLNEQNTLAFSAAEYREFSAERPKSSEKVDPGYAYKEIPEADREMGAAIALRLGSIGMKADRNLRRYVNQVGIRLLEDSPFYDESFVFIVLDSPKVQSFSTPGGFVFITTGAMRVIQDEDELAGVLAHEIIHVVERHGIKELEKQGSRIRSKKLSDTLDSEIDKLGLDKADEKTVADLENLADEMFETVIGGRKRADEEQADRLGTMLLYNAGYSADGLASFLYSAEKATGKETGAGYASYGERVAKIKALIKDKRLKIRDRERSKKRFQRNTI